MTPTIPNNPPIKIKNPKNLENITKVFFSQRRKMIKKNFIKMFKNYDYLLSWIKKYNGLFIHHWGYKEKKSY